MPTGGYNSNDGGTAITTTCTHDLDMNESATDLAESVQTLISVPQQYDLTSTAVAHSPESNSPVSVHYTNGSTTSPGFDGLAIKLEDSDVKEIHRLKPKQLVV